MSQKERAPGGNGSGSVGGEMERLHGGIIRLME